MQKICIKCGLNKSLDEFPPRKDKKDGRDNRCRACKRIYENSRKDKNSDRAKKWKNNNREHVREYKRSYKKEHYISTPRILLTDEEKIERYEKQKEKKRINNKNRYISSFIPVEKTCKYCGKPFFTQYKKSKTFCSVECADKHTNYLSKIAEKRRNGKITMLDRLDTDITLPLLFERDKGICQLCGELCSWNDKKTVNGKIIVGNTYPSVDHIKPISKGGYHTWDNVQLAHKLCNSIKSNKETL